MQELHKTNTSQVEGALSILSDVARGKRELKRGKAFGKRI